MLLASIALVAQVAAAAPARSEPTRPCADPSLLCRISPFFCPGTYPAGLEPCWPDDTRAPRNLPSRPSGRSAERGSAAGTSAVELGAPPAPADARGGAGNRGSTLKEKRGRR